MPSFNADYLTSKFGIIRIIVFILGSVDAYFCWAMQPAAWYNYLMSSVLTAYAGLAFIFILLQLMSIGYPFKLETVFMVTALVCYLLAAITQFVMMKSTALSVHSSSLTSAGCLSSINVLLYALDLYLRKSEFRITGYFITFTSSTQEKLRQLLSTGDQQRSVAASYRLGHSTTNAIFNETCQVLWETLSEIYLKAPKKDDWLKIADEFWRKWQFPLCLGAIDGKHIRIKAPSQSGSQFYNYKTHFSIILLAVCDANYRFTVVDIGAYGRQSDGGVFSESAFGRQLTNNELDIPFESPFPGSNERGCFVFIGDAGFPLRIDLMRPYPGENLIKEKDLFNYRLSRARRVIENAFGILVARWRIFERRINSTPKVVEHIVGATVCLHNFCMQQCREIYAPPNLVDMENLNGEIMPGDWRAGTVILPRAQIITTKKPLNRAHLLRTSFATFFESEMGAVPWQDQMLRRGRLFK